VDWAGLKDVIQLMWDHFGCIFFFLSFFWISSLKIYFYKLPLWVNCPAFSFHLTSFSFGISIFGTNPFFLNFVLINAVINMCIYKIYQCPGCFTLQETTTRWGHIVALVEQNRVTSLSHIETWIATLISSPSSLWAIFCRCHGWRTWSTSCILLPRKRRTWCLQDHGICWKWYWGFEEARLSSGHWHGVQDPSQTSNPLEGKYVAHVDINTAAHCFG